MDAPDKDRTLALEFSAGPPLPVHAPELPDAACPFDVALLLPCIDAEFDDCPGLCLSAFP